MRGIFRKSTNTFNSLMIKTERYFAAGRFQHLLILLLFCIISEAEVKSQDILPGFEDISVLVQVDGYGTFYTDALYSQKGMLYISVEDLFKYLKIPCYAGQKGDSLGGFIESENNPYAINYRTGEISFKTKITGVKNGLVKQMGMIFMESSLFGQIFGIRLTFNFRSLSVALKTDFELPVIKEQRIEKLRSSIIKNTDEKISDTTISRNYHLLKLGMLDWAIMSSQIWKHSTDTRLGLGLGAELLGGETNVFLNFSAKYKIDNRQQQYTWRWVNNDNHAIRQVQAGKISTQTISSVYYPVVGAVIGNTPTSVRRATGEYLINEVTQPDWFVELYINNVLMDFTKADASGLFMFKVPLVYGFTTITLRFYGPMGEERSETRIMNVPYSFLPAGEFEYRVSGGVLEDGNGTLFGRGEGNFGVSRILTMSAGVEYLASITSGNTIPFVSASFLPMSKLMIKGEYAHGVRIKGLMNYYLWSNSMLEIDYTKYIKGQHAILYNYLEERKVNFSIPLRVKNIAGFARFGYKQNVYTNLNYNMAELLLSAYYKQVNANISTYANWINYKSAYLNSMLALSFRMKKGLTFRPSTQLNISTGEIISYKAEVEKRFIHSGYISASYENLVMTGYSSFNFSFKYDLSFAQTNTTVRFSNHEISTYQGARGSLSFGSGNKHIQTSEGSTVGRGGLSLIPFVDVNHNGVFDKGEPIVDNLLVKINGGRIIYSKKDSIIRIAGLEPFISYILELSDKDFENLAWRLINKTYKILIDPNQFKTIEIPIVPVGEVSGDVYLKNDSLTRGLGRVLVNICNKDGVKIAQTLSESDGYVNYLGLEPGEYTAKIDSLQLSLLSLDVSPLQIPFKIKATEDGDIVEGINFVLSHKIILESQNADTLAVNNLPDKTDGLSSPKTSDTYNTGEIYFQKKDISSDSVEMQNFIGVFKDSLNLNEGLFYVQNGAFLSNSKAKQLVRKLAETIPYPFEIVNEKGYSKVRSGYFGTKREAILCYELMKKAGVHSFIGKSRNALYWGNLDLSAGPYFVQTGAFRKVENAKSYARRLSAIIPYPFGIIIEDGYYKLRIGYFKTKTEADKCYKFMLEKNVPLFRGKSRE